MTSKQRSYLKGLAMNIDPIFQIGKASVTPENIDKFITKDIDYIVDAIDTVKSKIAIIGKSKELDIPIISSMGTGNKLDPLKFKITDI